MRQVTALYIVCHVRFMKDVYYMTASAYLHSPQGPNQKETKAGRPVFISREFKMKPFHTEHKMES